MDEQQLRNLFEELRRSLEEAAAQEKILGQVSRKTAADIDTLRTIISKSGVDLRKLDEATQAATKAELDAANASKAYAQGVKTSAKNVVSSSGQLASSMAAGSDSFQQFGGITRSVADALGKLTNIPGIGIAADTINFFISQLDSVAKNFQELGRVGAITARGVDGMIEQFDRLGLVNLPDFVAAVKQSSLGLAALGPTVSRGARMFGDSLGQITAENGPFIRPLLALGYSLEEIASISGTFASTQALSGNKQIRTTEQLTQATVRYLREISELADATGRSRQQIVEERRKSEADARFQARLQTLREEGNDAAADELQRLIDSVGGPIADIIRASVTGVPLTEQATKAFPLIGTAVLDAIAAIERGAKAEDVRAQLIREGIANQRDLNTNIQYSAEAFGTDTVNQLRRFQQMFAEGKDPFNLARATQNAAAAAAGATEQLNNAQIAVAAASREITKLAQEGLPIATGALAAFTTALRAATAVASTVFAPRVPVPGGTGGDLFEAPTYQTGGIFPKQAGMALLHGPEAVVPLPDGKNIPVTISFKDLQQAVMMSGAAGANPYKGVNAGPVSTDINLIKQLAAQVGAFDRSTGTITDTGAWQKIVESGLGTNFSMQGLAGDRVNFGSRSNPELSATISAELAKLTAEGSPLEASLQKIASDYGRAMQATMTQFQEQQRGAAGSPQLDEMVALLRQSNSTQTRILQAANN